MSELSLRQQAFKNLSKHAWFNRVYKKLKNDDIEFCLLWIREHDHLNKHEFELKVHRMFIDIKEKPKRWIEMSELLHCVR